MSVTLTEEGGGGNDNDVSAVYRVIITAPQIWVLKGGTLPFSAAVAGTDSPSQEVT